MAPRKDKPTQNTPKWQEQGLWQKVYFLTKEQRDLFVRAARIAQGKTGRIRNGRKDEANFSEFGRKELLKVSEAIVAAEVEDRKNLAAERQLSQEHTA